MVYASQFFSGFKSLQVFLDDNGGKPGRPRSRPHLLRKWKNLRRKFSQKYKELATKGCSFVSFYEDDEYNNGYLSWLNPDRICRVSEM